MIFVKQDKLKEGMRLAKPIFDRKGVLLYDRNSKLTRQGIESVHNFGIIGLYILEPAEPLPPITEEDLAFEKFQMVATFRIQDEWKSIREKWQAPNTPTLVSQIVKGYGRLDHKLNFIQSLRSQEDKYYKHALNVAILCALISHKMNIKLSEQNDVITAALVHDIGKLDIPPEIEAKEDNLTDDDNNAIYKYEALGFQYLERAFDSSPMVRRIVQQSYRQRENVRKNKIERDAKLSTGAKILMVADKFDSITAMNEHAEPTSEISAVRFLMDHPEAYDSTVTDALIDSINLLVPGCTVELTNGDKGLVIAENTRNVLKPVVLTFSDNSIIDLGQELIYGNLDIKDVMKTMDNRVAVDRSAMESMFGNEKKEPEEPQAIDPGMLAALESGADA
ncbi:MAG: HD domain-containing protein [Lachnospiraceae bacterium]|nr:HD domain-containing protein [Lachnospiraceae bacterium]